MAAVHPRVLRCRIPGGGDRFWTVFGQVLGRFETVQSFKNVIDADETDGNVKISFLLAPLSSKGRTVVRRTPNSMIFRSRMAIRKKILRILLINRCPGPAQPPPNRDSLRNP